MPAKKRYELAENIWRHFGPSSNHHYRIGPSAPISDISSLVIKKLDDVVNSYSIPENVQNRFNWLAAGDIKIKEELLNYFRKMEKELARKKVAAELPVLMRQVRDHGDKTGLAKSVIRVHKHEISLWVDDSLDDEIEVGKPKTQSDGGGSSYGWVWLVVIAAVILLVLSR